MPVQTSARNEYMMVLREGPAIFPWVGHLPSKIGNIRRPASSSQAPSMFARLRMLLAAVFGVGAAIALVASWLLANAAADDAFDRLLASAAVQMAENITVENNRADVEVPDAAFETLAMAANDRLFYAVRDTDGRLLTGYDNVPVPVARTLLARPVAADARLLGTDVRTMTIGRHVSVPHPGWMSIVVAQTREARQAMAWSLMTRVGALIVCVSALGFFGSLAAAKWVLRPLAHIEHSLSQRPDNDVTPLQVRSPRETEALVSAINAVMARLGERTAKLQSFAGLAAHQVRTPIAALLAQIELLRRDETSEAQQARIDRLRDRLIYLGRLTNQLLDHAMVSYRAQIPRRNVDLIDIARDALRDAVPMRLIDDIAVVLHQNESQLIVAGDDVTLREAMTNLINNAVVHGAKTSVTVTLEARQGQALAAIHDDGSGIPIEQWDLARVPFGAARDGAQGAGLGLSIVHEIVAAHGGQLTFAHPASGGFTVLLSLPLASEA